MKIYKRVGRMLTVVYFGSNFEQNRGERGLCTTFKLYTRIFRYKEKKKKECRCSCRCCPLFKTIRRIMCLAAAAVYCDGGEL